MSEPLIEIAKGNYISRIWFFYKDGATFDVLMSLMRQLPDGDWTLKYRFRFYRDDQAFDSKDEKSFWTVTFPTKMMEAEVVRKASPVIQKLKAQTRMNVDVTTIESDEPSVVMYHLSQCRWANFKHVERAN